MAIVLQTKFTKDKNKKTVLLISLLILVMILIFLFIEGKFDCLFKKIFKIACHSCGMTRAMTAIFHGNFLEAYSYNILAMPIILFIVLLVGLGLYDLICKKNTFFKLIDFILKHYVIFIILPLIISMLVNNIRGI